MCTWPFGVCAPGYPHLKADVESGRMGLQSGSQTQTCHFWARFFLWLLVGTRPQATPYLSLPLYEGILCMGKDSCI